MASSDNGAATPGYEPPRYGHAFVEYKGKTYLVGGVGHNRQPISLSTVDIFDPASLEWDCRTTSGHIPEGIYFSVYTTVKQYLYMFGGGFSGKKNNDLWCLDLEKMIWISIKQKNAPSPRTFGGLVSDDNDRLVLFGGKDANRRQHNDVHIFSIKDGECCETALGIPLTIQ